VITTICFAVDSSLGKLCKWLRILGFDTILEDDFSASRRTALAKEGRCLLTRITALKNSPHDGRLIFIRANDPFEQLGQVITETGISIADVDLFSRCIRCNRTLSGVDRALVLNRVPDYIAETVDNFHQCAECGRIYWHGSHGNRMRRRVAQLFALSDDNPSRQRMGDAEPG
jgi:uncharacterized protein with PIN domain